MGRRSRATNEVKIRRRIRRVCLHVLKGKVLSEDAVCIAIKSAAHLRRKE